MKPWTWREQLGLLTLFLLWCFIASFVHHEFAEYLAGSAIVFIGTTWVLTRGKEK
jgi:hypothetical protein